MGKLTPDQMSLFTPQYVVTGELMNVGGSFYATAKLLDGNGAVLETVSTHDVKLAGLLTALRTEMKATSARQLIADGILKGTAALPPKPVVNAASPPTRPDPALPPTSSSGARPPLGVAMAPEGVPPPQKAAPQKI